MSSAAATIPGKLHDFMKHKTMRRVKAKPVNTAPTVKPKGKLGPARNFAVKTTHVIDNDLKFPHETESWMKRNGDALESDLDEQSKKSTLNSSLTLAASVTNNSIHLNGAKPNIKIMSIPEYEVLKQGRDTLRATNVQLQARVAELEGECGRLLGEFDAMYRENEQLRTKMDTGKQPLVEPYSRVFEDRNILREAEIGYKKSITRLQQEMKECKQNNEKLERELKTLKSKVVKANELRESQNKLAKLQKENKGLQDTVEKLKNDLKQVDIQKNNNANTEPRRRRLPFSKVDKSVSKPKTIYTKTERKVNFSKAIDTPHREYFDYEYDLPDSDIYG